jgi:ABC-type glutathione transport system ATPase component
VHSDVPTHALFIGGRSGVGKTTVAAEISRQLADADVHHALIEGDNLDQAHPQPWRSGIPLAERNLAAIWRNYRQLGYRRLIYTNTVSVLEIDKLSDALGGRVVAVGALLTASDEVTAGRLSTREIGSGLDDHLERSGHAARRLESVAPSTVHRVETDNRSVPAIAREVLELTDWMTVR